MRHSSAVLSVFLVCGSATGAPSAFHDAVAADAPVLWYSFDDAAGSGTVANSGSLGGGFDGSLMGGPTLGTPTLAGDNGILFDRLTQPWIVSGSDVPAGLLGNPDFTCEAVVNIDELSGGTNFAPFLFWGQNGTGRSVYFSISNNDAQRVYAGFYNGGLRITCPYTSEGWLHIVWTRDSAGGTNNALTGTRVWVNGVEVPLQPDPVLCCNATAVVDVRPGPFRVQRADDFTRYWSGIMDEVVLYDRVLSEAEVLEHYAASGIVEEYEDCAADINLTCSADPSDFTAWLGCFNDPGSQPYCDRADVNGDGNLDPADFTAWLAAFSAGCG